MARLTPLRQLIVVVNERCNLRCGYCYVPVERGRAMSTEVARKSIELLFEQAPRSGPVSVGFFGGEPFLAPQLLRGIAEHALSRRRVGQRVTFDCPTNATLLDDEAIELIRRLGVDLAVSLDGEGSTRTLASGAPSDPLARRALPKLRGLSGVRLTGRMTVTPENAGRLSANVRELFAAGLGRIVFLPELGSRWDAAAIEAWSEQQGELAGWLLELSRAGLPAPELPDWRRIAERLDGAPRQHCGAGVSRLTVDVEGTLFPCYRIAFDAQRAGLAMGEVHSGIIDEEVRGQFARLDPARPMLEAGSCADCRAASGCTLFCPALGLQLTGDIRKVPQLSCALMRPQVAACARLASEQRARDRGPRRSRTVLAASALAAAATLGATGCLAPVAELQELDAAVADAGLPADSGSPADGGDAGGTTFDGGRADAGAPDAGGTTFDGGRADAGAPDAGGCPPLCPGLC